jgi:flavin reductase (DIM6/NTAB) family NADH-FMN oxidoreductase RutF
MFPPFLKKTFGILPQEYVCVALEDMPDHPSVFMTTRDSTQIIDVTSRHLMLGYKPLMIAIPLDDTDRERQSVSRICLSFTGGEFKPGGRWRGFNTAANSIARLTLSRMNDGLKVPGLAIFAGEYGEHSFLPLHQAWANRLSDLIRTKPGSDANLEGNPYKQARIAYSVPRTISVVTVKDGDLLNYFPTDLHGAFGSDQYLSSLRIGGLACDQVQRTSRIVISTVDVEAFRQTYALGKNHMRMPQPAGNFEQAAILSPSGIPVYPNATRYLELDRSGHWDSGIHRIFKYRVAGKGHVRDGKTLAHIHRYYAQWRLNHHRSAEYFFR